MRQFNPTHVSFFVIAILAAASLTGCPIPTPAPTVTVPNVVGMTQAAAQAALAAAGLNTGTITQAYSDTVAQGNVITQNPAAGTSVTQGASVALVISQGPELVQVPNVVLMTQAAAQAAIVSAGLTVGTITQAYSNTVAQGNLISQNPAAGTDVIPSSAVALVISQGPEFLDVPNVEGMPRAAAQTAITGAGLLVGVVREVYSNSVADGSVVVQEPAGGTSVSPGSSVDLLVSKGLDPAEGAEETVFLPGGVALDMLYIAPGTFMMGCYPDEEGSFPGEEPQHKVTLTSGFWMGKYELTKRQWVAVMGTAPWVDNAHHGYVLDHPDSPAVYVSWDDAQEFTEALSTYTGKSFRLPSEAEWEYACRAGTATRFYWGDDPGYTAISAYAWWAHTWIEPEIPDYAQIVGQKLPNAWGLYDMSGNVAEWCADWYEPDYYLNSPATDPAGPEHPTGPESTWFRVLRGGGWDQYANRCRSAYRGDSTFDNTFFNMGFRVAR